MNIFQPKNTKNYSTFYPKLYLGFGIRDPGKKLVPDPGSRGQKGTGSRIRIRNTVITGTVFNLFKL
jgi:hypothetical protein